MISSSLFGPLFFSSGWAFEYILHACLNTSLISAMRTRPPTFVINRRTPSSLSSYSVSTAAAAAAILVVVKGE